MTNAPRAAATSIYAIVAVVYRVSVDGRRSPVARAQRISASNAWTRGRAEEKPIADAKRSIEQVVVVERLRTASLLARSAAAASTTARGSERGGLRFRQAAIRFASSVTPTGCAFPALKT